MLKKAYALALFSVISWASAPVIFKALVDDLDFKSAVFFFLLFGSLAMFAYLKMTHSWRSIVATQKGQSCSILIMGLANYLHYFCYTYSLSCINASTVIVLAKLSPIFQIALAIPLLSEKVKIKTWLIFLLGFVGATIAATNGDFTVSPNKACLTAILAGFFWALFIIIAKKSRMDRCAAVGWALLVGAILTGFHLLAIQSLNLPEGTQWLWLILLGVVPTALGVVAWVKAIDIARGVAQIANFEYLVPSLGVMLSWLVLKEVISAYLLIGLVIILSSIYLNKSINSREE